MISRIKSKRLGHEFFKENFGNLPVTAASTEIPSAPTAIEIPSAVFCKSQIMRIELRLS